MQAIEEIIERAKSGIRLELVSPTHIDQAWRDGAHMLSEACKWAADEVTPDQLKMLLAENRRALLSAVDRFGKRVGWAAVQVQQLPNIRVLYVFSLYAPGATEPDVYKQLADFARGHGCSSIRGACRPSMVRYLVRKLGARPIYTTCDIALHHE